MAEALYPVREEWSDHALVDEVSYFEMCRQSVADPSVVTHLLANRLQ